MEQKILKVGDVIEFDGKRCRGHLKKTEADRK